MSELDAIKNQTNLEETTRLLNQLQGNIPSFSWVGVTDKEGTVQTATNKILAGQNISQRPVFQQALKAPFIGDVHEAVLLAKLLPNKSSEPLQFVDISMPLKGKDGTFNGVLAAHLSWEWSQEVKSSVLGPLQREKKDMDVFIISSKDQTILLGPEKMTGKSLSIPGVQNKGKQNEWELVKWPDGKKYLTGFAYGDGYEEYPGLGWTVIVRQSENAAFASVKSLQSFIFVIGAIISIGMAVLGWVLAKQISRPLRRITEAARKLKNGEDSEIPHLKGIKDVEVLSQSLRELVSSLKQTEFDLGEMETIAMHDPLTGLPNRLSVYEYIKNLEKPFKPALILYLDLDGFKKVNDTFGHHYGDIVLKKTGERIKKLLNHDTFFARLGGDEFLLILPQQPGLEAAGERLGTQIIEVLSKPFRLEGMEARIGCSIGVSVWEDHKSLDEVLKTADQALYEAKENGKNQVRFFGGRAE